MPFDTAAAQRHVDALWEREIVPTLRDYIRIPNVSSSFDPSWASAGHMDRAVALLRDWAAARAIDALAVEVVQLEGRTPLLLIEVPAGGDPAGVAGGGESGDGDEGCVLLYGHLDKQPPMHGWRDGLGPWEPVIDGDRLFGRGGADDGYAVFAALGAIEAVRAAGGRHARCVVLIEASEESGSPDLPAYVEHLAARIGRPDLVVCLDSGAGDYERLWVSTSLRGVLVGNLRVDVLTEGVHSGMTGGAPDSFRIARSLLSRVEDQDTGAITVPELHTTVPAERRDELRNAATVLGASLFAEFPFVEGVHAEADDATALLLRRTWEPSLTVTTAGGLPPTGEGGAVLRPWTELGLSFRLPPGVDPDGAAATLVRTLTERPPYGAKVAFDVTTAEAGWSAPVTAPWLAGAVDAASRATFGAPPCSIGIGGTIPFMARLGARFPDAQFLVTGVLGPGSNAHGPNEFLHLPTGRRVTSAVAAVLDAHANRS